MKQTTARALAIVVGLTLAGTGVAQTRHDEKPHAMPRNAAATAKSKQVKQSGIAGRHDERPHGAVQEAAPVPGSK